VVAADPRGDARLLLEALAERGVGHQLRVHQLQRARLVRAELRHEVHRAHTPGAQGPLDAEIPGEHGSWGELAGRHVIPVLRSPSPAVSRQVIRSGRRSRSRTWKT